MKKLIALLLCAGMAVGLAACGGAGEPAAEVTEPVADVSAPAETVATAEDLVGEDAVVHQIGVLVYDIGDDEVVAFREYLENYIEEVFPDVQFVYSASVQDEETELAIIDQMAEAGVEGIMSFNTYDLATEVAAAEAHGMYYLDASSSMSQAELDAVADNEYFLGVFGPGVETEYQAGVDMAQHFIDEGVSDSYFILSGGSSMANDMHLQRTIGMLDTLQAAYGVTFDQASEEIAVSAEPIVLQAGDLNVCVCPGYISIDVFLDPALEAYEAGEYGVVMAALPISGMADAVSDSGAKLGVVDCFSTTNLQLFNNGTLDYVAGKYGSLIGPSFAAMYNAVTGYAADFRDNGAPFQIQQGFWVSDNMEDYVNKYTFASSVVVNAYNFDDLDGVCKVYNPDATLDDLKALAAAYTYEDVMERRGLE